MVREDKQRPLGFNYGQEHSGVTVQTQLGLLRGTDLQRGTLNHSSMPAALPFPPRLFTSSGASSFEPARSTLFPQFLQS